MEMERRSTIEDEEPRTDNVYLTLTSDPHDGRAKPPTEDIEGAHSGNHHSIEAIYPSSLDSRGGNESKELQESTSDGEHNDLNRYGAALERDDCSFPVARGAARTDSINKLNEPSTSTALVPYVRFRLERDEYDSKEGLTQFPRLDEEPETSSEGSANFLGKQSLGASFDDASESESPDDSSGRQPAPYESARQHPSTGANRRVRWNDVRAQDHDTFYSSDIEDFRQDQSSEDYYQDQRRQKYPEPRRLSRVEVESWQARRGSEDSGRHHSLDERRRSHSPYEGKYPSDSDLSSPLSDRFRNESPGWKRSLSGSRRGHRSRSRSSSHQEDNDIAEDARRHSASERSFSANRSRSRSPRWFHQRFDRPWLRRSHIDSSSYSRNRSQERGYMDLMSAERDNNAEQVASKGNEVIEDVRNSSGFPGDMRHAWFTKRANFGNGVDTELVVINAAESFAADEKAKSVVTLYCQKNPLDSVAPAPRQIQWLHVRHTSDILKIIKSLIICCPIIEMEYYKSLALGLLEKVTPQDEDLSRNSARIDHRARTNVLRIDGVDGNSVTYYSTPYFVFREGQTREMGHDTMESLLSAHYGYDVGEARDKMQILLETQKWLGKDILQVARMKFLLIGPDVLLTWGEVPLLTICNDSIIIDESNTPPLVTVKITDFLDKEYNSYIKHDISFAELIAHITNLTSFKDFDVFENKYGGVNVTSETWATILERARIKFRDIRLNLRRKAPESRSRHGRHSKRYAPPPANLDRSRTAEIHTNGSSASKTQIRSFAHTYPSRAFERQASTTALVLRPGTSRSHMYTGPGSGPDRHLRRGPLAQGLSPTVPQWQREPPIRRNGAESFSSTRSGSIASSSIRTTIYERDRDANSSHAPDETCQSLQLGDRSRVDDTDGESDLIETTAHDVAAQPIKLIEYYALTERRESRTYHLSSSGSEIDRGEPSPKPASIASRRSFVRTRSRERPRNRKPPTSFITPTIPFLMWKVTQTTAGDQKEDGSISTMVRLLRKIDRSLQNHTLYGRIYNNTYGCYRHDVLSVLNSASAATEATTGISGKGLGEGLPSQTSTQNPSYFAPRSINVPTFAQIRLHANTIQQADKLIRDIFTISKMILGLYLPLKDDGAGFYADIRGVIDRFWGALDMMFRHIRFAALMNAAEGEQSWTVKGTCSAHAEAPADAICSACDGKTEYDLVGALEHLHAGSGHTQSTGHKIPPAPHEDPCIVWLQNAKEAARGPLFFTLIEDLTIFKQDLGKVLDESRELHLFVARPDFRPEKNVNHEAQANRQFQEQQRGGNQTEAPALPTSLLRAFQNIVALFCVQARMILLTSREKEVEIRRNSRAYKGRTRYSRILETAITSLGTAREDMILAMTTGNTSSVRLGAVGAEYIVAMAMANVQTGAFRTGAGSSKVPQNVSGLRGELRRETKRRALTWAEDLGLLEAAPQSPSQSAPMPPASLNLIALYEAHARALGFNASLRPQRRAFFAIRALEQELRAIQDLNVTQWHCLNAAEHYTHPMSFPVQYVERTARFALEWKVIHQAKAERRREYQKMLKILHEAAELRARVKENIEVLDEGHGNAIRVFTLVTLFFLPLSFVTSFFGMNTVDVRDMPQGSWMYWVTAVPITLLVLCSAYLYAYKWEAIRERVTRETWLDEDVSNFKEPHASRPIETRRPSISRRLGDLRKRRRSNLEVYSDRRRGDTLGLARGETMADIP